MTTPPDLTPEPQTDETPRPGQEYAEVAFQEERATMAEATARAGLERAATLNVEIRLRDDQLTALAAQVEEGQALVAELSAALEALRAADGGLA